MNGLCEFLSCRQKAIGAMHAQWTLFDFGEWEACLEHRGMAFSWLTRKIVDGVQAYDVWWVMYDDYAEVKES
jgi:hypothetical protein